MSKTNKNISFISLKSRSNSTIQSKINQTQNKDYFCRKENIQKYINENCPIFNEEFELFS